MRRKEFEINFERDFLGLALDCAYYSWQHSEITDEEFVLIERRIYEVLHRV